MSAAAPGPRGRGAGSAAPDVVVLGGGHNGLVAAAYLARAGRRVLLLERRAQLGGAAVSERPFAGHDARLSRYSYLVSLLPRSICDDLGITIELRDRRIAACAPTTRAGRPQALLLDDGDPGRTAASIADVTGSLADHTALGAWNAMLGAAARRLFPTLTTPLPTRDEARTLLADVPGAWEVLAERPLGKSVAARFDDPLVRGTVLTDGLIGTFASIHDRGLRQNACFLYHVIGGGDGRWRVPVGGMGALTAALAGAARSAGAELRTGAEVVAVDGAEVAWRDADGAEHAVRAQHVLAGLAPAVLARLRGHEPPPTAPGSQTKVNLLLDRLPRLACAIAPEDAFAGTLRLHEDEAQLEAAYAEAARGVLPAQPPAELYCHTLTDRSILGPDAPAGQHTLTLFGLHTPPALFARDHDATRDALLDRYLDALDAHLDEPVRDLIARDADGAPCVEVRTPQDLERELALPEGNIFHGDLAFPWTDGDDDDPWGVATDDPRILRCGAGARRGGGVSAVGGHNAAMALLHARRT